MKIFSMAVLFVNLLFLSNNIISADISGKNVNGVIIINGQLTNKLKLNFEMKIRVTDKNHSNNENSEKQSAWSRNAVESNNPIETVVMSINGQEVLIPDSAFADITSVNQVNFHPTKTTIIMTFDCGEGGDHEIAEYIIVESHRVPGKYQIVKRKVYSSEFKDDVWEQTIYHNHVWDNPDM